MIIGLGIAAGCALGALTALMGVVAMAFPGRPRPWPAHLLRRSAWLAAASAAAVYSLGLSGVLAAEWAVGDGADSTPAPACRDGFAPATVQGLSHHRASYLPLGFDCVREDGSTYTSDPDYAWMNRTSAVLALSAAALAVGAGCAAELRARAAAR
ncbi:hypothetical protein [Streptomyces glaucus]|uniref:Integral membrane protein n=1 Tax=Streptomyces glaucus TaxID=284029 RepID=A0ABN3JYF5_9ACTN